MSLVNGGTLSTARIEPAQPIIPTKQAAREINGQHVEVLSMLYTDRILVNVTMGGKVGQLISVALANSLPRVEEDEEEVPPHLDPKFLLGSANDPRGEIAQLYALQIASQIARQNPRENRTLLVGMGLTGRLASDYTSEEARSLLLNVIEMVNECRAW